MAATAQRELVAGAGIGVGRIVAGRHVENREGIHVEEVLLTGGGILAPGAIAFIEQFLGRPVRTWNPLEGLRVSPERVDVEELEASASSLAVAIGLASRVRAA